MRAELVGIVIKIKQKWYNFKMKNFLMPFWKKEFKAMGTGVTIGKDCDMYYSHIEIGDDVQIGAHCSFIASVSTIHIGNHVMFGPHVTIRGGNHQINVVGRYMKSIGEAEKTRDLDRDVFIEDDVWIGCNVTILSGVRIGKGSVIGAGSVVVKDVPPYTIYVGNHEPLYRPRFNEKQITEHERLLRQ